jgi:hypothetical protein
VDQAKLAALFDELIMANRKYRDADALAKLSLCGLRDARIGLKTAGDALHRAVGTNNLAEGHKFLFDGWIVEVVDDDSVGNIRVSKPSDIAVLAKQTERKSPDS